MPVHRVDSEVDNAYRSLWRKEITDDCAPEPTRDHPSGPEPQGNDQARSHRNDWLPGLQERFERGVFWNGLGVRREHVDEPADPFIHRAAADHAHSAAG